MDAETIIWPVKSRDMHNHHMNSTIWDDFQFRDDDIIIGTYAKSGTTWMQQIVSQLIFDGAEGINIAKISPWVDMRVPPKEVKLPSLEAQTHRRFIKTHLPVDALRFSPRAKYIYIARDGRDVVWSLHNHHVNSNDKMYDEVNNAPGRIGPALGPPTDDIVQYFEQWLTGDGYPYWPFWENIRTWWEIRDLPNVLMVHFADLKADMAAEIRRIAEFLDIPVAAVSWDTILLHCSFDYMKANAAQSVPKGGELWEGGAETFLHKGANGRWRDMLSAEHCAAYEEKALAELGEDCARWLAGGNSGP